jgi:hypothetical protein
MMWVEMLPVMVDFDIHLAHVTRPADTRALAQSPDAAIMFPVIGSVDCSVVVHIGMYESKDIACLSWLALRHSDSKVGGVESPAIGRRMGCCSGPLICRAET